MKCYGHSFLYRGLELRAATINYYLGFDVYYCKYCFHEEARYRGRVSSSKGLTRMSEKLWNRIKDTEGKGKL